MRARLLRIIVLSSLLGACATQDSYIAEGWDASPQARSVLVVPTNFDLTPPTEFLLGVNMTTDAVCERFERSGRNVERVSLGEVFEALGGAADGVDPARGADPSLRRSAVARVLAAAHDADLVVMPSVVIRDAKVRGRNFAWDGVSRPYLDGELAPGYLGVGLKGDRVVSSARIVAFDREGTRVFEGYGGLEPMVWLELDGDRYRYGLRQDLFRDAAVVERGVGIALRRLLPEVEKATASEASPPAEDERWRRFESISFSMMSNVPEARARRLFEEVLRFVEMTKTLFGGEVDEIGRFEVILFADNEEFQRFAGQNLAGYAAPGRNGAEVALSADANQPSLPVLYHELVHVILFQNDDFVYPAWYHEGLAELMSSALVRGDIVTVGAIPLSIVHTLKGSPPLSLSEVISRRSYFGFAPEEAARYYTDAWVFVHLLNMAEKPNGERYAEEISAYIRALNRGKDWREAIESAFDMSLEDLDGRYREHRENLIAEGAKIENLSIPDRDYSFSVAELPESVALVRLGDHALVLGESKLDLAERYFQRALELEPAQIEAEIGSSLVSAQRGEFEEAEERLSLLSADGRLAASIHEARGIVALHRIQSEEVDTPWESGGRDVEAARRAFRQAVALDPDRASAWLYLGSTYVIDPSSAALEGIVAFLKAEALQPGVLSAKLGLGVLYARAGRTSEARFELERVVASHDEWHAREALRLLEGLSDLEAGSP